MEINRVSMRKRLLASAWDFALILSYALFLFACSAALSKLLVGKIPTLGKVAMNLVSLSITLPVLIYFSLTESPPAQASYGKRRLGLKVISVSDQPLNLSRIVFRNVVKLIPWQFAHLVVIHAFSTNWELTFRERLALAAANLLPLVWFAFLFRQDGRALHDLIAGTYVVDQKGAQQ